MCNSFDRKEVTEWLNFGFVCVRSHTTYAHISAAHTNTAEMGRVGTHTRPGIIPKSTACAPLVHWNHYSSERGRGESPPAEARSTRLFPDQSKSTSLALQIIQDFYLAFHSKSFLCPSILFILQFICIYIYTENVKLEKFTKKKEKYMRIFRSCQSYDNEVIMIHAKVFRDPFSRNDSSKLQKNR